ncbi:unnamed protein product [Periconia digitata]|uniref:Uncharacterized protein n=1 Tax=Periconia digitata TaxID=1303443 RepID=A0A9W4U678_9PLEO|nr:unnamed protein product [Periconia digitata]
MALDMLNADHHHSPPRPSPSPANASFLQMPLSILGSVLRRQSPSPAPSNASATSLEQSQLPLGSAQPTSHPMSASPSRPSTSSTAASLQERPRKRASRPKTVYNLAQPPPTSNPRQKKLSVRPKVLLQLHQVVASRRPKPVYEAVPYSILGPVSSRRLARSFQSRKLTPHDILIVSCGGYDQSLEEKMEDDSWGARDVVAVICPAREDRGLSSRAEIILENGQIWEVGATPNGAYEFNYTDDHGLCLKSRWVPKASHLRRRSTMSNTSVASPATPSDETKFNFSTISANSRRHPVIATLTKGRIEIQDSYVMPAATSPSTPSQPNSALPTPSTIDMESFMDPPNGRLPVTTDDDLRRFIVISGVWVAFCENWSTAYSNSRNTCTPHMNRAVSMPFVDSPRSASPASTIDETHRTIPRIIRTSTQLLHRNSSFTNGTPDPTPSTPSSPIKTRPRRANSTGTAELIRAGSTKKKFGLALEEQILIETEEERQARRSTEILRIKELSLPPTTTPTLMYPTHQLSPIPSAVDPGPTLHDISNNSNLLAASSPLSPSVNPRDRKARSAYDPVVTAGLWDSGIVEGGGRLKTRPTSMVIVNEKKQKAAKKESKNKDKGKKEKKPKESRRKSEGLRQMFHDIFRKEKKSPVA